MKSWWEIETTPSGNTVRLIRPVAYYRHSAQDRQENSIPIQRDQVREWATKNGVEIIHEFADAGKSGLNAEGRPAFTEMMEEWVKKRKDFDYVLCLDVSRWGRFQDIDLSAQFSAECRKHQKQIIYTTIGKPHNSIAGCFPERACRGSEVIKCFSRLHQEPLGGMQSMTLIRCEQISYALERPPMKMIIASFASAATACFLATFAHADDTAIAESAQATKPLVTGDSIPDLALKNVDGGSVPLGSLHQNGPVVLVFFRGGWCPICTRHTLDLIKIDAEVRELGAQLVGISPDDLEHSKENINKNSIPFQILSDSEVSAAKAFGLAFRVDDDTLERYKGFGTDLEEASGQKHHALPVPAVFIVDQAGKIVFAHSDPDYRKRLDTDRIISELKKLQ